VVQKTKQVAHKTKYTGKQGTGEGNFKGVGGMGRIGEKQALDTETGLGKRDLEPKPDSKAGEGEGAIL